ncbi:MAG TPA: hypothetical protein VKB93_12545 [Thermoanaerobaculia bacterium]|nr:hypothetical protein [Thermoanaerobaculia bacterium]
MKWICWFLSGALAVPLAHHIALYVFYATGLAPYRPYSFAPTQPLGVPQLLSLMFWGGVWGLVLGAVLLRVHSNRMWWIAAILFGAIAPTLVAGIIAKFKGGLKPTAILALVGLTVNAAWGLGTAVLYKLCARWAGI